MKTINGDITTVDHGFIVQQVNAQGVMNSGVAKALREKYPQVWIDYSHRVQPDQQDRGLKYMGRIVYTMLENELTIASIVGQQFYGRDAKKYTSYDALDTGFERLGADARATQLPIAVPLIGCGLGGGQWNIVKEIIEHRTKGVDVTLWLQNV